MSESNRTGNLLIAIDQSANFDEMVAAASDAGLTVTHAIKGPGIVIGSPTGGPSTLEAVKSALQALPGVVSVEDERGLEAL